MKKKQKRTPRYCGMDATTTAKDWGFHPVPCKGGKTTNYDPGMPDNECRRLIKGVK